MLSKFLHLVRSVPFFKLLRVLTDLDVATLNDDDDENESEAAKDLTVKPSCLVETRRWQNGCFTILDDNQFKGESCLDCIYNLGCEG